MYMWCHTTEGGPRRRQRGGEEGSASAHMEQLAGARIDVARTAQQLEGAIRLAMAHLEGSP